jgi:hypothetical protein
MMSEIGKNSQKMEWVMTNGKKAPWGDAFQVRFCLFALYTLRYILSIGVGDDERQEGAAGRRVPGTLPFLFSFDLSVLFILLLMCSVMLRFIHSF